MDTTITAIFDGQALRPETPVSLRPQQRYEITIHFPEATEAQDAWATLDQMSGSLEMPEDWSEEHDHYLHGAPKRSQRP